MSFFVVGRGRSDGLLRLLHQGVHETREDAVRAVQALASSGVVSVDDLDVYIADIASATPVMIVGMPSVALEPDSSAGAWEAPASAIVHDLPSPDPGDVLLADALQRAASRLESEGIIAPESVGFDGDESVAAVEIDEPTEPEPAVDEPPAVEVMETTTSDDSPLTSSDAPVFLDDSSDEFAVPSAPPVANDYVGVVAEPGIIVDQEEPETPPAIADDLSAVIASLGSLDSGSTSEPDADAAEWPWLNVGEVPAVASEQVETSVETVEDEPVHEPDRSVSTEHTVEPEPAITAEPEPVVFDDSDSLIVTPAIDDDFMPQPIIMGDYATESAPAISEDAAIAPFDGVDETAPAGAAAAASLPEVAEPAAVYEPAGDLALEAYTCADCVYSNTCPKVNQTTPAECGAFQWKAV
ncbi:MAG: hypothetical protein D9V44_02775 [Actinobacteria bacterium]|nr:MAG: hypothetical protein D9V44_02775 [Actinomycetota bacterium]